MWLGYRPNRVDIQGNPGTGIYAAAEAASAVNLVAAFKDRMVGKADLAMNAPTIVETPCGVAGRTTPFLPDKPLYLSLAAGLM